MRQGVIRAAVMAFVRALGHGFGIRISLPRGRLWPGLRVVIVTTTLADPLAGRADPAGPSPEPWSQLADTVFQNYAEDQGLPQRVARALAIDGEGFLWVGTFGGLARWDGYRFRQFHADPSDQSALPDNSITALHTDPGGGLWIGTASSGLVHYEREHDRFRRYPTGPQGLNHPNVLSIADDGAGGLWAGGEEWLDHFDPETGWGAPLSPGDPIIKGATIQALLRDHQGRLWVGSSKGLAARTAGTGPLQAIRIAGTGAPVTGVSSLFEDGEGRIWIGSSRHGAYVIDPSAPSVPVEARPVLAPGTDDPPLTSEWVSAIGGAAGGEIWLATLNHGIVAVDPPTGRVHHIRHDASVPETLADDHVAALLADRAGSIWAGSYGGLSRHLLDQSAVLTLFGSSARPDGIIDPDIVSTLAGRDETIWLGLRGGGLDRIDPITAKIMHLRPDPAHPETGLPAVATTALAQDRQGAILAGTSNGLYRIDPTSFSVNRQSIPRRRDDLGVTALLVDQDVLWVGGRNDGLWGVTAGSPPALVFDPDQSQGLTDPRIKCLVRGSGADLWVGTGNGLNRIDLTTHAIEQIPADPADPLALPTGNIVSLLVDQQGRLWVGSFGGGISVLVGRDQAGKPRFRHLGRAEGMRSDLISRLLEDRAGTIWASTDQGLAAIDPRTFEVRRYQTADGVAVRNYWVASGAVSSGGDLLFGGFGGLTVVRPGRFKPWTFEPPLVVTDLRVGGVARPVAGDRSAGLTLTPATNSLAVEFSSLDFTAPERNRYAYWLQGYDPGWIETDASRRLAAYTNLPPGDYRLRLRGSNRDGVWAEPGLSLSITVLPAWHQTLWFRAILVVMGLAGVVAIVQARTRYLRQRQRQLEAQVASRTADLAQTLSQLQETMAERERLQEVQARDLDFAHDLQIATLPPAARFTAGNFAVDVFAQMAALKEVGGDFYDFAMLDEHRLILSVGDASGKGVPAAMFTTMARSALHAVSRQIGEADGMLAAVNDFLALNNPSLMFVTALVVVLDLSTGRLTYASAGHPWAIHVRADGTARFLDGAQGMALGVEEGLRYDQDDCVLEPGDTVLLYSDGISEAEGPDDRLYGEIRLAEVTARLATAPLTEVVKGILADVEAFAAGIPLGDDTTILVFRRSDRRS